MDMLPDATQAWVMTESGTFPVTDPIVAEMLADPPNIPVESPVVGPTVATVGVSELQAAAVVTFCVLPSE